MGKANMKIHKNFPELKKNLSPQRVQSEINKNKYTLYCSGQYLRIERKSLKLPGVGQTDFLYRNNN